jgi:WD40 repeat protein
LAADPEKGDFACLQKANRRAFSDNARGFELGASAMFSGDGRKLVTASPGFPLRIWDVATGDLLGAGPILNYAMYALSHDGQLLAAGGSANEEVVDV